jgi:uncharacterized protein
VLDYVTHISLEIIPIFLVAIFFSSLIDYFLPEDYFSKTLSSKNQFLNLILAAVLGSLVPICTCGMIPLAVKLNKKGLDWILLVAFLTAGNANSIPAMLLSSTISYKFVVYRFIVSVVFGILTAYLLKLFVSKDYSLKLETGHCHDDNCCNKPSFLKKLLDDLKELSISFLPWIFLAIFLAALMHKYIGIDSVVATMIEPFKESIVSPFFLSIIGFPFYFCAGADVPLAKEFLSIGLPFGSVLAFMLAAPGINLTSLFVYKKAVGLKASLVYLTTSIFVLTVLGVVLNLYGN